MEIVETYEIRELTRCTKDDKWLGMYKGMLLLKSKVRGLSGDRESIIWHCAAGHMLISLHGWEIEEYDKRTKATTSRLHKIVAEPQMDLMNTASEQ